MNPFSILRVNTLATVLHPSEVAYKVLCVFRYGRYVRKDLKRCRIYSREGAYSG